MSPPAAALAFSSAALARAVRAELEEALGPDVKHWAWSRRLSLWCDALVILAEEHAA